MNNRKVKEIIKFSFYKSIQNKWFIIFNVISLITAILIINWGSVSNLFKTTDNEKIFELAVLDSSNLIYDNFKESLVNNEKYKITKITENSYTAENIPKDFAIVEIIPDETECFKTSIISSEGIDINIYNPIIDTLNTIRNDMLMQKYDVSNDELKILQSELDVNRVMLSVNAEDSTTKEYIKLFSSALTYIISVLIFSKLASEIAQEKQSKSTEYILTTVSEREYLFAKIFANISILIIQGIFLLSYYFIGILMANISKTVATDLSLSTAFNMTTLSKDIVLYVVSLIIYNVLNLILLCIILSALASKTSSNSEAGNVTSIIVFIMMIAYAVTLYFITPYSEVNIWFYIVSCLPILSAYFVPAMMVIGQANVWQIIISLAILIISIPISFNISARIFKNGILDYTRVKKSKLKESSIEDERKKFLIKRKIRRIGFVTGIAILIYIGIQTIFSLIGGIVLPSIFKDILSETDISLILQMILQIISLGIASIFVLIYADNRSSESISCKLTFKQKTKIVFIAVMMIFAMQYLLSLLIYPAIGLDYDTTDLFDVNSESSLLSKIILILSIAITPGIFEELFFRKAIIDYTSKYGKKFALLFSALLFGLLHMNLSQGLFAFVIGIIFGSIYLYTGDIKLTMLIHFINNGFAALELILPEMWGIAIAGILLLCLITGLVLFIIMLAKKESRKRLMNLFMIKVSLKSIKEKYIYVFSDYAFDISIILVILMSIMTEKMLR